MVMSDFLLSQMLVCVTLIVECIAMQQKRQNKILAMMSVSCLFNGLHFLVLEQATAGFIFLFASIRFLVSIKWKSRHILVASLLISFAITVYSYGGLLSILGLVGTIFITVGSFSSSDKALRILMIIGSGIWLVHNVILWTPVGIILEAIFVVSGVIGCYRIYSDSLRLHLAARSYERGLTEVNDSHSRTDYPKAMRYFRKAAVKGNAKGQLIIGIGHALGLGVVKDLQLAVYWLKLAAAQRSAAALYNLGRIHENGNGVCQDRQLANHYYHRAAKLGNARAQFNLGLYYGNRKNGYDHSYKESAHWLGLSASQGNAKALRNLAVLYSNGWGVPLDKQCAQQLLSAAATQSSQQILVSFNKASKKSVLPVTKPPRTLINDPSVGQKNHTKKPGPYLYQT